MNNPRHYQNRPTIQPVPSSVLAVSRNVFHELISILPRDLDSLIKVATVTAIALSFIYGFLINQTVAITAEYSSIELELEEANAALSEVSANLAAAESGLESVSAEAANLFEVEPTGFVSRDISSGFTYQPNRL